MLYYAFSYMPPLTCLLLYPRLSSLVQECTLFRSPGGICPRQTAAREERSGTKTRTVVATTAATAVALAATAPGTSRAAVQRKETQLGLAPKRHTGGRGAYPYAAHRVATI